MWCQCAADVQACPSRGNRQSTICSHSQCKCSTGHVQETWLLSEFCDKGNMDRALSGGRFHDKATSKPEMVRTSLLLLC